MRPPRGTPANIRMDLIFPETRVIGLYIFVAACMGLSSLKFVQWLQKTHLACTRLCFGRSRSFRVIQGRWFWYQSKARIRLPISRSLWLCPILHCFWDIVTYWLKTAYYSYLSLIRCPRSLLDPQDDLWGPLSAGLESWWLASRRNSA